MSYKLYIYTSSGQIPVIQGGITPIAKRSIDSWYDRDENLNPILVLNDDKHGVEIRIDRDSVSYIGWENEQ